jgi:hypothetical protein
MSLVMKILFSSDDDDLFPSELVINPNAMIKGLKR